MKKTKMRLFSRFGIANLLSSLVLLAVAGQANAVDLQVSSFTDTPDPAVAGGNITYSVRVENNATDFANNVVVQVTVPATTTFVSVNDGRCAFNAGANRVDCAFGDLEGTLAAGNPINFDVVVKTSQVGTVAPQTTISSSNTDTNPANNTLAQNTTVGAGADLVVANVTGAPATVTAGGVVTYTVSTANNGPSVSTQPRLTFTLSPETTYVANSAAGTGWTCSGAAQTVTCNATNVAVGALPILTLQGTVGSLPSSGNITATATISENGGTPDPIPNNNSQQATVAVAAGANLSITKTVLSPAIAGTNVTFTLLPRNTGPSAAVNVVVTDTLPAGWTYVSATGTGWTCTNPSAQIVSCTTATYAVGATNNISLIALAPNNATVGPTGTVYTNSVGISSDTADPNAANNNGTANVNVLPDGADYRINFGGKTPTPVAQGADLTSTLSITNLGPRAATGNARIVIALSAGETYVSSSGTGWTCNSLNATTLSCDYALGAGLAVNASSANLAIITNAGLAGTLTSNACTGNSLPAAAVGATAAPPTQGDPNTSNDCLGRSVVSTGTQADLSVTKLANTADANTNVATNETYVDFTISVTNAATSTGAATGMVVTDTLPAGFYLAGKTTMALQGTSGFTCGFGATITCTQNGGDTLAIGATRDITIRINRPFGDSGAGTFTNNVSVTSTTIGDAVTSNNSGSTTFTVDPIADVEVTGVTVTPNPVKAGVDATYVISYRNNGPSTAQAVSVNNVFTLPGGDAGYTLVSATSTKGTCTSTATDQTCTIGAMASGETQSITVKIRPNWQTGAANRIFTNTATISTSTVQSDVSNDAKNASLTINPAAIDLIVNTTDLVDPVAYDSSVAINYIDYKVNVNNAGPSLATGVQFNAIIAPANGKQITFVGDTSTWGGALNAAPLCNNIGTATTGPATTTINCNLSATSQLAAGANVDVYLRFRVDSAPTTGGDTYTITPTASASETEANLTNNTEGEQTTVRTKVDLSVLKTSSKATVNVYETFTYTLTVGNAGPGDSSQTDITDTLPANVKVVTPPVVYNKVGPAGNGNCVMAGQTNGAGGTIKCAMGALNKNGTATITFDAQVISSAAATVTNNVVVNKDAGVNYPEIDSNQVNNTANNVVNLAGGSIAGLVFLDRNDNGIQEGTSAAQDKGIAGTTLTLTGKTVNNENLNLTVVTDANGNYKFDYLPASDAAGYTITETQPVCCGNGVPRPGTVAGAAAGVVGTNTPVQSVIAQIVLGAGQNGITYNFPETVGQEISGYVYLDANNNGVKDGAEIAFQNVTVTMTGYAYGLNGTDDGGAGDDVAIPNAVAQTDASGKYLFTVGSAGKYTLTEQLAQPQSAGKTSLRGKTTAGTVTNGGTAGAVTTVAAETAGALPSKISNVILLPGSVSINNNFGEILPGSIAGYVFTERNATANRQAADDAYPGVTITLTGTDDLGVITAKNIQTDANGAYIFNDLRPGTYVVTETQPGGVTSVDAFPGKDQTATTRGNKNGNDVINTIAIVSDRIVTETNFAELNGPARPPIAIKGKVYADYNNDGNPDANEPGFGGVTMNLTGTNDLGVLVNVNVQTLANGTYSFDNLRPGTYKVTEQTEPTNTVNGKVTAGTIAGAPTGVAVNGPPSLINGVTLVATDSINNNFGEVANNAAISGKVFSDSNNDGVFNGSDTAIADVIVTLNGTDSIGPVSKQTTTDANGQYRFDNLLPGTYRITEPVQPSGTMNGITKVGTIDGVVVAGATATPTATVPSEINTVTLPAGKSSIDNNFAEFIGATLSGTVWYDIGATSRVLDGGDRRLPGWTVEVIDPSKTGAQQLVASVVTRSDGSYSVPNLVPGVRYDVRFRDPGSRVVFGKPVNGEQGGAKYTCKDAGLLTERSSCVKTDGAALSIVLLPGDNMVEQSLPVDPSGVVYDASSRAPVPGSVVTLAPVGTCPSYDPNLHLVNGSSYNISGTSASMTVGTDGFYQFLYANNAPASCQFQISVSPPANYTFVSKLITPAGSLSTPPAPGSYFVQTQANPPAVGQTTTYYLLVTGGSATQSVLHNHIPLDPAVLPGLTISKTGSAQTVELGDSLTYTIKVRSTTGASLPIVSVTDSLPAGFKYIKGTSRQLVNGVATVLADPVGDVGPVLTFNLGAIPQNSEATFSYRVRVGVGAQQGDGVNRAQASAGSIRSNVAQFKVTVTGGVFTQDACVLGKIFVDCNNNHIQDPEELGIPGVRLYIEDGTYLISDVEGKYSICGLTPRTHAIKVDKTTLPFGSRLTTSSNRNAGDANSLFMDLKNGELHRADFIEGSCSNTILEQVKARRANGETRAPQTERKIGNGFTFSSKPAAYPQQGTDSANQRAVKPRYPDIQCGPKDDSNAQCNTPVPQLQINPPSTQGGAHAQ